MDQASKTIDRHAPTIPSALWQDLPPEQESTYTYIKNMILLPNSPIPYIARSARIAPRISPKRIITDGMLAEARSVLTYTPPGEYLQLLHARGITDGEIAQYRMQDTRALVERLQPATIEHLTLRLPVHLPSPHDIGGISIPILTIDTQLFMGFATWVCNNPHVKYAFSIPQRLCFGYDSAAPEVYVCEGIFDALALRRLGLNPLGMGDSQPNYFKMRQAARHRQIHLLFDDDMAGALGCVKAYMILTQMLGKSESEVIIRGISGGLDPESAIRAGCTDFLRLSYDETVHRLREWIAHETL